MYGYGASLLILLLRDSIDILSGSAFLGIVTLILHTSFCLVAPLFLQFKKNDNQLPIDEKDTDLDVEIKLLKMKLGGAFCTCAGISSFFLPLYSVH